MAPVSRSRRLYFRDTESDAPGFTQGVGRSRAMADAVTSGATFYAGLSNPLTLSFDRGSSGATVDAHPDSGDVDSQYYRGFLTHFISGPFDKARRIPPGFWRIACKAAHLSATSEMWFQFAIYSIDAAGATYAWAYDKDAKFTPIRHEIAEIDVVHLIDVPCRGLDVPVGGRIVIEPWVRQVVFGIYVGSIGTQGVGLTFYMNGYNESMGPVPGGSGTYQVAETASYVDLPRRIGPATGFASRIDPLVGVTHQRIWATDVIEHKDGSEQRTSLRATPNVVVEFRAVGHGADEMEQLDAWLQDLSADPGLIIWWRDEQTLPVDLAETDLTAAVETVGYQFVAGEQVIIWQGPFTYEILTLDSVAPGLLTFTEGVARDWAAGSASIMPLKEAVLIGALKLDRVTVNVAEVNVAFAVYVVPAAA